MKIRIYYFAQLREKKGKNEEWRDFPKSCTVGEAAKAILEELKEPQIFSLPFRYALNSEFVLPDQEIRAGDELAILSPVAGG